MFYMNNTNWRCADHESLCCIYIIEEPSASRESSRDVGRPTATNAFAYHDDSDAHSQCFLQSRRQWMSQGTLALTGAQDGRH